VWRVARCQLDARRLHLSLIGTCRKWHNFCEPIRPFALLRMRHESASRPDGEISRGTADGQSPGRSIVWLCSMLGLALGVLGAPMDSIPKRKSPLWGIKLRPAIAFVSLLGKKKLDDYFSIGVKAPSIRAKHTLHAASTQSPGSMGLKLHTRVHRWTARSNLSDETDDWQRNR
jgi:hypothetical protein